MECEQRRALIVDDDGPIRRLVAGALSKEAFKCETADSGWRGLEMATAQHFDVVVTDLVMAKGDGHAFCRGLINLEKRPYIIVLTGNHDPAIVKDLIERGVDDIVFKPINLSTFAAKARSLVERQGRSQQTMTKSLGSNSNQTKCVDDLLDIPQASANALEDSMHDFNNLLQTIRGYTKVALAELPTCNAVYEDLEEVMNASNRAIVLMQHIDEMVRCYSNGADTGLTH